MDFLAILQQAKTLYSQVRKANDDGRLTGDEARAIGHAACGLGLLLLGSAADTKATIATGVTGVLGCVETMVQAKKVSLPPILEIARNGLAVVNGVLA